MSVLSCLKKMQKDFSLPLFWLSLASLSHRHWWNTHCNGPLSIEHGKGTSVWQKISFCMESHFVWRRMRYACKVGVTCICRTAVRLHTAGRKLPPRHILFEVYQTGNSKFRQMMCSVRWHHLLRVITGLRYLLLVMFAVTGAIHIQPRWVSAPLAFGWVRAGTFTSAGSDLNQKFNIIITPNTSFVCCIHDHSSVFWMADDDKWNASLAQR